MTRNDVSVDPWDWDHPYQYINTTYDAAGYFKTDKYLKSSFRRADVARVCKDHHLYRVWMPDRFVHKYRYINWNCYGMSCQLFYRKTTDWISGYCFKSVNSSGDYYVKCW